MWLVPNVILLGVAIIITGIAVGGQMPLLMSIPVRLKEIGPSYAGTAGGIVSTLQLLGAVTLPTYVIAPLAGGNFTTLFALSGVFVAFGVVIALFLPRDI